MHLGPYEVLRQLIPDTPGVSTDAPFGESYICRDGEMLVLVQMLKPALLQKDGTADRLRALVQKLATPPAAGIKKTIAFIPQFDGSARFVSSFVDGESLSSLLPVKRTGALPGALLIARDLAVMLAAAHAAGLCHLRLRPAAVIVDTPDGTQSQLHVYLVGLGLAAALELPPSNFDDDDASFLAPEQRAAASGSRLGDALSDVYALGVLMARLWSGQAQSEQMSALIAAMMSVDPLQRPKMAAVAGSLLTMADAEPPAAWQPQLAAHLKTMASPSDSALAAAAASNSATPKDGKPRVDSAALVGTLMGNFRLLRRIGEGGMGVVYEAEHQRIGHRAAVKVLHAELAESQEYAKRFLNEARAVNIIRHPGLVEIFEYGQQPDGTLYIVMEFLDGQSLHQRLARDHQPMPVEDVVALGLQLTRALAMAHDKGVIHRDLKPENIMLVPDPVRPNHDRVKILDFGIAKLQRRNTPDSAVAKVRTGSGAVIGTPLYMAPEQFGHAESVEGAADVFTLGVIFYELLAGQLPYSGGSLTLLSRPAPSLQKKNPAVPARLAALIKRMTALSEAERPTMAQAASELQQLFDAQEKSDRPAPWRYVLLGSVAAALILGGGYFALHHKPPMTQAEAKRLARVTIETGLRASDAEEKLRAVQALGRTRDLSQSSSLEPLLSDGKWAPAAARALGDIGAVAAQPALLALLEKSGETPARLEAASALMQVSHPKGVATLQALLTGPDLVVQLESALRLLEHGDLSGAPLLKRLVDNEASSTPRVLPVLSALSRAGDAQARQKLTQLAAMPGGADPLLLHSLARAGDAAARARLATLAGQAGPNQTLAARLLASLGECTGYDAMIHVSVDGKQPDALREIAIEGLADCERLDATIPLALLIRDAGNKRLSLAAAGTILRLFAGESVQLAERSLSWSRMALGSDSTAARELAVALLGEVDSELTVAPLRQALRDREREVRRGAAKALGRKHVRAALEALTDTLRDADSEVRRVGMRSMGQVVAALRQRGDQDADKLVVVDLRRTAQSSDEIDRMVASGILMQMGDLSQRDTLRLGMQSQSVLVRRLAVEMMDQDVTLLRLGLADADRGVRFAAARRLVGMGMDEGRAVLREIAAGNEVESLYAYGILRKLGETLAEPPNPTAWLRSGSVSDRAAALEIVGELPAALAYQLLLGTATDSAATIRQRTVELSFEFLARTGQPEFKNLLVGMRSDPNMAVRLSAAEYLTRLPQLKPIPVADQPSLAVKVRQETATNGNSATPDLGTAPDLSAAPIAESPSPPIQTGTPPANDPSAVTQLIEDARAAIKAKKYPQAQTLLDKAQRQLGKGGKSAMLGEVLALRGNMHELRGQWRQAMAAYTQFQRLPAAQQKPSTAEVVNAATARLKERMGLIQIFTVRDGQCRMTEEYYLPAGDHIISLGAGQTRTVAIEAGITTPVKQCP